jgi:molybdopterin converting factor small subunit
VVRVRYFAALRERRKTDVEEIELLPGETLGALYLRLFPPGPEGVLPVAYARNTAVARANEVPRDGDEIAFLPPVGGG